MPNLTRRLGWWKVELGAYTLAALTSAVIGKAKDRLRASANGGKGKGNKQRGPATVNRCCSPSRTCSDVRVKVQHFVAERRGRHFGTTATDPTNSREPLARDMSRSPFTISSSGSGSSPAGRALCSDSTNEPPLTQPAFKTPHSSPSASGSHTPDSSPVRYRARDAEAASPPNAPESPPTTRRRSPSLRGPGRGHW